MNNKIDSFMEKMLEFFPVVREEYNRSVEDKGEILETIVMEDIFIPEIIKLLSENTNGELLGKIFQYIEEVVNSKNVHLTEILSVTLFEVLGNDKMILKNAQKYMGSNTIMLQIEADKALGRV